MPCVKGKGGRPRSPPGSPKKLRKAQKRARKLTQLESERKRKQIARKKGDPDVSARCLEFSQFGIKSDIEKCNIIRNYEEETAKLKHNKCQCCRMVRLDLKLNKKGICQNVLP